MDAKEINELSERLALVRDAIKPMKWLSGMSETVQAAIQAIATLAAREDGWRPLRDAPYGQEVVAQMDDSSQLVGAIRQSDEDWWWRGSYWSADRVQAWRPIGLPAAPPAQGTGEGS